MPPFLINTVVMRAKEFIKEYAVADKPLFQVKPPCFECKGTGNIDRDGTAQTCPVCKGQGTTDPTTDQSTQAGYTADKDYQMNMPDTLWAAGKF